MKITKLITGAIAGGLVGGALGYYLHGEIAGNYLAISTIFFPPENTLGGIAKSVAGVDEIRTKIITYILIGAGIGVITGFFGKKRR